MSQVTTGTAWVEVTRQLWAAYELYLKDSSPMLSVLLANANGKTGTNKKYEWYEHSLSRIETTTPTGYALATFTAVPAQMDVANSANLKVGDLLRFEDAAGNSRGNMTLYITAINSGVSIDVMAAGGTDVALSATDKVVFKSSALPEGSNTGAPRVIQTPVAKFNYFQIVDFVLQNSRTLEGSDVYGDTGKIIDLRRQAFFQISRQLTEIFSNGVRNTFTNPVTNEVVYSAGGISEYVVNLQDALGVAFDQDILDTAVETIIQGGGRANVIRCNTAQAKRISKMDNSKIQINLTDSTRGNVVTALQAGIPVEGSKIETIIVDTTMPQDEIELFDISQLALIPYSNGAIRESDASQPGQDGFTLRMLAEMTFEMKNSAETSVRITNLLV